MLKLRKAKGFTLIELLVVVVIIGILAAIALPNFIGAQQKAKLSSVKANMHTCQLSAESYATDTGGVYGAATSDIQPYFPGGSASVGGTAGTAPTNPFTNAPSAATANSSYSSTSAILTARTAGAGAKAGAGGKGVFAYSGYSDYTTYGIIGGDNVSSTLMTSSGIMVLSNQ